VEPDIVASITNMSEVLSASVDAVYAAHALEHLFAHEVPLALKEFLRVLKPGGFALIIEPDLQAIAQLVANDKLEDAAYASRVGPITPLDMIYGYGVSIAQGNVFMAHHTGFTAKTLCRALTAAGFAQIRQQRNQFTLAVQALTH